MLLDLLPDRIGHGTFLNSAEGGTMGHVDFVRQHRIPLGKTVSCRPDNPLALLPPGPRLQDLWKVLY